VFSFFGCLGHFHPDEWFFLHVKPFGWQGCRNPAPQAAESRSIKFPHFMEKVVPVQNGYRDELSAITHVDGSGRLQTVKKEHNERFYNIISEVGKISGFPIVLNTSFNINGEPIVQSADDALNTFFNSGLTHLILGKYLIKKSYAG
jgi:predicted NodU family carbamoyl transferase